VYYLIKGTPHGEQILFQGERHVLLQIAQHMHACCPQTAVRVTDRPVDVFGNSLLEKERWE
jgi:hypothetical protein